MVERRGAEDGSFLADGLSGSNPPASYGTGRICSQPDCGVRLSRYNSTNWCSIHESPTATGRPFDTSTRQRGRRRNSAASRQKLEAALSQAQRIQARMAEEQAKKTGGKPGSGKRQSAA